MTKPPERGGDQPVEPRPELAPASDARLDLPEEQEAGGLSEAAAAGERAAKNTLVRALGEITGKLATLALFALLARSVSQSELGAYVFALAWAQITEVTIGPGYDRYLLRRVAKDASTATPLLANTVTLKLLRSVLALAVSFTVVNLLDYQAETRTAVYILSLGLVFDGLAKSIHSVFNGFERGGLIALTHVVQRIGAAALGIVLLTMGFGIVAVSVAFTLGALTSVLVGTSLLVWHLKLPRPSLPRWARRELRSRSFPYAVQDVFGVLLAKIDAVILSLLVTQAAVGAYGAAYRLLEATFFLTTSVSGASAAMFTYLGHDTKPSVGAVFERAIKTLTTALTPAAVVFVVLPEWVSTLFFGPGLADAAGPLRLLAPVVVLIGVVVISTSLIVSRENAKLMVPIIVAVVIVNVALNLLLIPRLGGDGAAAAMLLTEVGFVFVLLRIASRTVGGVSWSRMLAGPSAAGITMLAVTVTLASAPVLALAVGAVVYLVTLIAVERVVSPADLRFAVQMLVRQLPDAIRSRLPSWVAGCR